MGQKLSLPLSFFVGVTLVLYTILWIPINVNASTLPDLKGWTFSDDDAQIIKYADIHSASAVLNKLYTLFIKEGKEAVIDSVPALVYRFHELRKIPPEKHGGEGQGEFEGAIIDFLGRLGDERSKSALLASMEYHHRAAVKGMLAIGHSVVPDIINLVGSPGFRMKTGAMATLWTMGKLDPTFFTQEERDTIRNILVSHLGNENVNPHENYRPRVIHTLEVFGDLSTIPTLEKIAAQDSFILNGKYISRIQAENTIEKIRAAQQSKNELQSPVNSE